MGDLPQVRLSTPAPLGTTQEGTTRARRGTHHSRSLRLGGSAIKGDSRMVSVRGRTSLGVAFSGPV